MKEGVMTMETFRSRLDTMRGQVANKFDNVSRLKLGVGVLVILLAGAGVYFLWPSKPSQAQQQAAAQPATVVTVVQAKVVKLAPKLALPGTVVARSDSKLASEVEGKVAWVAEVGTSVNEGDVVARLDNLVLGMQLAQQKANVARLAASSRFNRDQAGRMQKLFSSNAIAQSQRDQAVSTRDMTNAELAQADAQLKQTQYQYDHSEIRAPFPGRIAARLINAGEYATPGKDIVRLVDIGSIEVKTQSPIDTARFLHEGMIVPVEIEDRQIQATVRAIVPVGDELSRTIEVRLTLKPGDALVGDAAKVLAPASEPKSVLAVPRDALILREDSTYIFKVSPKSEALRVAVETGSEDRGMVEVKGQIAAGDRVVVQGGERLEAGQKVAPKGA
ncbi:MAG: efflux RND transporter periplasmic adaptor subunit [Proteobacteria bacterium]|nr:efflux RND transporter periplasmic adaptor subunit [Pseudomonadota bacterium]